MDAVIASDPTAPMGPAWRADPKRLGLLRKRAARRHIIRELARGHVRDVLLKMCLTMHKFGRVQNHSGAINELVAVLNVVELAVSAHAVILAANPAVITAGEAFAEQDAAIAMIRSESHFDGLLMRAASRAYLDGEAPMRADYHETLGTIVRLESVDEWLPVGEDGPDMQPTVWERRWFVERVEGVNKRKVVYMRVERHRVVQGRGVIEQEAYRTKGSRDTYADLATLQAVPLNRAVPDNVHEPVTYTGLDRNLIYRMVTDFDADGMPRLLLDDSDLALFDTTAAAFSRLAHTMELHGKPKARVGEQMVRPDGTVDLSAEALVDPDKLFEYILANFDFASLRDWAFKVQQILMVRLRMSPALHGIKHDSGATPDTYDKLRLESTAALMAANTAKTYFEPAIESLIWVATVMESMRGLNGWPVGEVDCTLHPEIPADMIDRARAWAEIKREDLVDEEYAIRRLHGDGAAEGIIARLGTQRQAKVERDQAVVFSGFGSFDPTPPAGPEASDNGGAVA